MAASFFFYDLETSGFDARNDRIMQFAGVRTDMELQPIGEPVNIMIKMSPDTVPSPEAIMITGITPQATITDGVTEAEFLKTFYKEVVTPDTCFLGFNSVRFDDEFMRFLHYRNFYDSYEWQWSNGCSRWDLLDVVRMTRALRPDGIVWPFDESGKPTNRLELITKQNDIDHYAAHDALSDVYATIAVAKLIHDKQPKLFEYLFEHRGKKKVEELATADQPFLYSSGKYPAEYQKTTAVVHLADQPQKRGSYVYDLRHDPTEFAAMTPQQLVERWQYNRDPGAPPRLPVKLLQFNHCPAVAPLGVLDVPSQERLSLDLETIQVNLKLLRSHPDFAGKILQAVGMMDEQRDTFIASKGQTDVDGQLYDGGFFDNNDKQAMRAVQVAEPASLESFIDKLHDERLKQLVPRYKARNYPDSLTDDERRAWEEFCRQRLVDGGVQSRLAQYFAKLEELATSATTDQAFLLEELQLYGQSLMPAYDAD